MNLQHSDFPDAIETTRLIIRPVRLDDARKLNEAVRESFAELHPWMPWAERLPTMADSAEACRSMRVKWLLREELMLVFFDRETSQLIGCGGFHHIIWSVPAVETGYWCRTKFTGKGFITEALKAVTEFAFDAWHVARVALTCDERNERSWRVAERAGFRLEGILHHDQLDGSGRPRITHVYACTRIPDGI